MLNSTLKMVRGKIAEKYQARIDYLYTTEAKEICNQQNLDAINRLMNSGS
jgi:long-chain acyl-CoA synthetase